MQYKKLTPQQTYLLNVNPNEDILNELQKFIRELGIKSGYILGLGAVKSVRLAHYSVTNKKYTERKFKKPLEITNLFGIITTSKIHLHSSFASQTFKCYAGHLVKAIVAAACEIIVVETREEVGRKYNEEIGLELLALK
jgi:predicted DNA-binding protein with PD1-like motif